MPHCSSCSAPLPAYSSICEYCGTKNDVDLQGISEFTVASEASVRRCPLCDRAMDTIELSKIENFSIERCPDCRGLFFDPDELNALLDKSVDNVYRFNLQKIHSMNQMVPESSLRSRAYIRCPVCSELMNRVNFGKKSGVVIDQCAHGIWLDSGELRKLLEWRKAGGQLYHEQIMSERAELEQRKEKNEHEKWASAQVLLNAPPRPRPHYNDDGIDLSPLLKSAAKLVWRLFI